MKEAPVNQLVTQARTFLSAGKVEEARTLLNKALETEPNNLVALFQMAVAYNKLNDFKQVIEYGKKALEQNKKNTDLLILLGNGHYQQNQLKEALGYFETAIELNPNNPIGYVGAGKALNRMGRHKDALTFLQKASNVGPDSSEVYNHIGKAQEGLGNLDDALTSYRMAMANWQGDAATVHGYSQCLLSFGEYKTMEEYAKSIVKTECLKPNELEGLLLTNLIVSFLQGNFTKSAELVEKIGEIKASPNSYPNATDLAECHKCIKDVLKFKKQHDSLYKESDEDIPSYAKKKQDDGAKVYIIGDANSLTQAFAVVPIGNEHHKCIPKFIMHMHTTSLSAEDNNKQKELFKRAIQSIPKESQTVFMCGQKDCFVEKGILSLHKNNSDMEWSSIQATIEKTVKAYVAIALHEATKNNLKVTFYGIPTLNTPEGMYPKEDIDLARRITKEFNSQLQNITAKTGHAFIDIYRITSSEDGTAQKKYYINDTYLRPDVFLGISQMIQP